MSEIETQSLSARIARIERQNRRLRWVLGVVVAASAAAIIGLPRIDAVSQSRTVAAERFELRRPDGSLAGVFGVAASSAVTLALLDRQKRVRATIGVNELGNPGVVLISPSGQQRVTLADTPNGPAILLFDSGAKARWTAVVTAGGQPALQFLDAQGAVTWKAQ